jgi:glucose/arabinose dehydrogenase
MRYRPWQSVAADNAVWHKWQVEIDGVLPVMKDSNLAVEYFTDGLSSPTKMAFLDDDNILVLEKSGAVKIVRDGVLQTQPVPQVAVNTQSERGLIGIAALGSNVFLYYSE